MLDGHLVFAVVHTHSASSIVCLQLIADISRSDTAANQPHHYQQHSPPSTFNTQHTMSGAKTPELSFRTERSNSASSTMSSGSFVFGPRRGSQGQLFGSLQELKRRDDPVSVARRQSMSEQRAPAGMFGTMWNT